MEATTVNESLVLSFTLCEAGRVLRHHMFSNPSEEKKMNPRSFFASSCHAALSPFVLLRLLQSEEKLSAFVSVRLPQSRSLSRTCLALVSYCCIVFQKQRAFRIEQRKDEPEEAKTRQQLLIPLLFAI